MHHIFASVVIKNFQNLQTQTMASSNNIFNYLSNNEDEDVDGFLSSIEVTGSNQARDMEGMPKVLDLSQTNR